MIIDDLQTIATLLGGAKREGVGWRCLCPAHADRKPSLCITATNNGRLLVKCWSGCEGRDILREIRKLQGLQSVTFEPRLTKSNVEMKSTPVWVEKLWQSANLIQQGDLASRYLANRGLKLGQFPNALRFQPECKVSNVAGRDSLPALLARFDDPVGKLSTVHRIYLQEPGKKAEIGSEKRIASSPAKGGAIRLFSPANQLGIAEGIETALACYMDTGVPTWACYSSSMMPNVVIPPGVKEVIVFSDNDISGAGQRAANSLSSRLFNEGYSVKILVPPFAQRDWLDMFNENSGNRK